MSMLTAEHRPYSPQATRPGRQPQPPRPTPRTPARPPPGRRTSADSAAMRPRPMVSPAPGRTPPPLPSRGATGSPSVMSGREGSTFTRRGETVHSPPPAELELFAHHCRVFYFTAAPPEDSANYISRTLAALPPAHRAAYTRVQSSLRAQAHLHHLRVRISSFHALMAATAPNSGLSLPARSELAGRRAQTERADRLGLFIRTWGGSAGALEPFFRGLWSVLRVQSRGPPPRGGAGPRCVVWEVDDAVFLESGGPEFMHEAVTIMKGVLGFTDQPLTAGPRLRRVSHYPEDPATATQDQRMRSGSDPFTDRAPLPVVQPRKSSGRGPAPPPPPSRRRPSTQAPQYATERRWPPEDGGAASPLLPPCSPNLHGPVTPTMHSTPTLAPTSPISIATTEDDDEAEEEADLNKARFRLWTFPTHINDEEAENLMTLFPRYVSKTDQRFPLRRARAKDLELGSDTWMPVTVDGVTATIPRVEAEDDAGVLRAGTGRMWVGTDERGGGWGGGGWFRFKRWWRRLFGRG